MNKKFLCALLVGLMSAVFVEAGNIDPKADELLHAMSKMFSGAKSISFSTSEVHDRHSASGKTGQFELSRKVLLKRPDALWMQGEGTNGDLSVWYNGQTLTLQSDKEKVYGQVSMPPTIDEAIDYAATNLDTPMPMADLFYSSPYDAFVGPNTSGGYVSDEKIGDQNCALLNFQDDVVDWRIWIDEDNKPVVCKLEITYKQEEGKPKSVMTFSNWNFDAAVEPKTFEHTPPEGYSQIPILGLPPAEKNAKKGEK